MQHGQLSFRKLTYVLSFVCLALVLASNLPTQHAEVSTSKSVRSVAQPGTTTTGTRGKYNGKLVFSTDRQNDGGLKLWTMNPDGSNQTQLTFESERGPTLPDYVPVQDYFCRWSPDGTKIALRSNRNLDLNNPAPDGYTIYVMDYQSKSVQRLILDGLPALSLDPDDELNGFEWSPDGTKFLLTYNKVLLFGEERPTGNIYTVNTDGTGLVRLTSDVDVANSAATWSPDGDRIAFISGMTAIDVMNADGSNRHEIVKVSHFIGGITWSPDGSKLLFPQNGDLCGTTTCWQLYTIRPDGTDLKGVTSSPIDHISGRWSPDGVKIAFERRSQGPRSVIFVMNAEGSDEHEVSNHAVGIGDSDVDWQPLPAPSNDPPPSVLGLDAPMYIVSYPNPPSVQITVTRSGNLDQTVSCDYSVSSQQTDYSSPRGTFTFAPGETSKTFQLSYYYSSSYPYGTAVPTFDAAIYNNWGNATFVGGVKHARIIFVAQNANAIDNSAYFVRQQYRDFLSREPDASGWDFWINNMDTCAVGTPYSVCQNLKPAKRVDTSAAFFLSIEFQQTGYLVYRTYKAAYGNLLGAPVPIRFNEFLPDTQQIGQGVVVGQSGWEQALEINKQNFMTSFVQRSRFTSAYPSSMTVQQFVDALYTNAGLVPTSAPNRPKAISEFNSTTPADPAARARALRDVAEDAMLTQQEFDRAFVLMQYFGYLRRNPNDAPDSDFSGYNFWLGKLNQFGGNYQAAEMVKAFIVSSEYRQRFGL